MSLVTAFNADRVVLLSVEADPDGLVALCLLVEGYLEVEGRWLGVSDVDAVIFSGTEMAKAHALCESHGLTFGIHYSSLVPAVCAARPEVRALLVLKPSDLLAGLSGSDKTDTLEAFDFADALVERDPEPAPETEPELVLEFASNSVCPGCGVDWFYGATSHYGCDVRTGDDDRFLVWQACCEYTRDLVPFEGFEAVYGLSLKAVAKSICGLDIVEITEEGDGTIVCRLAVENPTVVGAKTDKYGNHCASSPSGWRTELFDHVDEHHRHHGAPVGWKFGLAVHNGGIRVGAAVVGRPTSRAIQSAQPHTLEVTRVVTWGTAPLRKNASSKLYSAACKQAKKLGYDKLITYTLDIESGHSLVASGWTPTHRSAGGSWDCPSRPREDKAPIGPKVRWEKGLTKKTRKDVAGRKIDLTPAPTPIPKSDVLVGFPCSSDAGVRPSQDSAGPVTAWWMPGDGMVLNDATFPVEVASYLWKGERAFFQASILKPGTQADAMVQQLWLHHLPESERAKLRSWCPADVVMALTDEVVRRTGDCPQWTVHIMPLSGSPYYKFHPDAMKKVLAHSAVVCPDPCEIDLSDSMFRDVMIAAPATKSHWMPFRPLKQIRGTHGYSQEAIATWVTGEKDVAGCKIDLTPKPDVLVGLPYSSDGVLADGASELGAGTLISAGSLRRKSKATKEWAWTPIGLAAWKTAASLDSAGFVAMKQGGYRWDVSSYVEFVVTNSGDGSMPFPWQWWSAMDYCVEPEIAADRSEVLRRVQMTVDSYEEHLETLDWWRGEGVTDVPDPMPILQGRTAADYMICATGLEAVLKRNGRPGLCGLVGLGSVCRRDLHGSDGLLSILEALDKALPASVQLHLFGVKGALLPHLMERFGNRVASIDSMAWDYRATREACMINKATADRVGVTMKALKGTADWTPNSVEHRAGWMAHWYITQMEKLSA